MTVFTDNGSLSGSVSFDRTDIVICPVSSVVVAVSSVATGLLLAEATTVTVSVPVSVRLDATPPVVPSSVME